MRVITTQFIGLANHEMVTKAFKQCSKFLAVNGLTLSLLVAVFKNQIPKMFVKDPMAIELFSDLLWVVAANLALYMLYQIFQTALMWVP